MQFAKIELTKDLARHLRAGHPWVYKRALERPPSGLEAGAIVDITERGKFVARGYYDPLSPIAVRVLTRDPAEAVGPLYWRKKIARAVAIRRAFVPLSEETDCCRLIHGEGDGMPGVVADLYGKFVVLKLYSAGLTPHRGHIVEALRGELSLEGVFGRDEERLAPASDEDDAADDEAEGAGGRVLWGKEPPALIIVKEGGVQLAVDVRGGQKTGMFLDQRENRAALRRYSKGRKALNCFSFTGGFSVQAALGGAREVTSVDRDGGALALARKNFELNGLDPAKHHFATGDVLEFLTEKKHEKARYDLIVLDPPAFAKTQKAVPAALDGYASLHRAALAILPPQGLLVTASCSARVSVEEFLGAVKEAAAKTHTDLQLLEERRQPPDHPVSLAFPEGRYLKYFVFRRAND